jgi:hypothetical protein
VLLACQRGANRSGGLAVGVTMAASRKGVISAVDNIRRRRKIVNIHAEYKYHPLSCASVLLRHEDLVSRCSTSELSVWALPQDRTQIDGAV